MKWLLLFVLFCASCTTTRYVDKPYPVKSTEYRDRLQKDSIYLKDSIFIRSMNDTILIEKFRTKYVEKLRTDTLIKVDSIPVPYEVIKVTNELTEYQKVIQALGYIGAGAILLLIVLFLRRFV